MNRSQSGLLTAAQSPERLAKLEFFAGVSNNGSAVMMNIGYHKNKNAAPAYYQQDGLIHSNSGNLLSITSQDGYRHDQGSGLNSTRFGKGFQRRGESLIANPIKEMKSMYASDKAVRSEIASEQRIENLKRVDSNAHFNFFTGELKDPNMIIRSGGKKSVDRRAYVESVRSGQIALNEGPGRYFGPFPSGNKHDYRQFVLVNEGVYEPRSTSIIQVGKKDLPSFGIEDQFIKSSYYSSNSDGRKGLYEMRQPGAFTPRKQPMHPSANPTLVHSWTSAIDLNNNTLKGHL